MVREVKGLDLVTPYATALFALARAQNQLADVRAELEEVLQLTESLADVGVFFRSAVIDADARARVLEKAFRGRLSDLVLNTVLVMNRHGRLPLFRALVRAYVLQLEAARDEIEVTATSAVALEPDQQQAVAQMARRLAGRTPLVEFVVDPAVIGGLVLEIGDHRYDYSVRRQLMNMRDRLLQRARVQSEETTASA